MNKDDRQTRYSSLLSPANLTFKIKNKTKGKILKEIDERLGTLSNPSKMPGHGWSISAKRCKTGAKLREIPGTPCYHCYAHQGRYPFPNVQDAMEKRYERWLADPDWTWLMAARILMVGDDYFRWFDSGDIQSVQMLEDINEVAWKTNPFVKHWVPTQERKFARKFHEVGISAPNLTIRISSTKIDELQRSIYPVSYVTTKHDTEPGVHLCEARSQGNKCRTCRMCWDSPAPIALPLH